MGQTIRVEGEPVTVDHETTVGDLRDVFDIPDHDVATYADGDEAYALADEDRVINAVDENQNIVFQPARGTIFG